MIRNKNLARDARRHIARGERIDMSTDAAQATVILYDPNRDIKIRSIQLISVLDGNTGTEQDINVGISTDDDKYAAMTTSIVAAENALGTSQVATLLSTDLLAAGTALIALRESGAATNTAEYVPVVEYEYVDQVQSA